MPKTVFEEILKLFVDGLQGGMNAVRDVESPIPGMSIFPPPERLKAIDPAVQARIQREVDLNTPLDMAKGRDGVYRVVREKKS